MSLTPRCSALFLDRDGVINIDYKYINKVSEIIFNREIFEICRLFKKNSYKVIVITNQSGIGRGLISPDQYSEINSFISKKFDEENCSIDLILTASVNPDDPGASVEEKSLRKPNPGMILMAKSKLNLNLSNSVLIGDNLSDMQAGKSAGISKLYLISNPAYTSDFFESYIDLRQCLVRLRDVFKF